MVVSTCPSKWLGPTVDADILFVDLQAPPPPCLLQVVVISLRAKQTTHHTALPC